MLRSALVCGHGDHDRTGEHHDTTNYGRIGFAGQDVNVLQEPHDAENLRVGHIWNGIFTLAAILAQ